MNSLIFAGGFKALSGRLLAAPFVWTSLSPCVVVESVRLALDPFATLQVFEEFVISGEVELGGREPLAAPANATSVSSSCEGCEGGEGVWE